MRKIKWNNIEFSREHGGPKTQLGPMAWNHAPGLKLTSGAFLILSRTRANIANCGMNKTRPAAYRVKWNSKAGGNKYAS